MEIPVLMTSLESGLVFSEPCQTTLVNAHGCGLIIHRAVPKGIRVRLEIISAKRHTAAHVADVVSLGGDPETWLLGVELDNPGNFWGIEYSPSDWRVEENLSRAESKPAGHEPLPAAASASPTRRWRLTDISAGACYLETGAPYPVGTPVLASVRVANSECLLDGVVRVSHPQSGMGVEFISRVHDHRARVEQLITLLATHREVPRVLVGRQERPAPQASQLENNGGESPMASDPLLELIRMGDSLPAEEFFDDLKAQRLGQRREPRIEVSLPVLLTGADISGRPLDQRVTTINVSRRGALLEGIYGALQKGDKVFLARRNRKEEFRVAWVGAEGSPEADQIGVVGVVSNPSLWEEVLKSAEPPPETTNVRNAEAQSPKPKT
ncbi:MAG: hypothetical protein HY233_10245 [Acidobacteriales bacterium]|nr:hypothetical protein [Candidatus Koribacter versatilis]MBI3646331.1 hypothetical protein [Terriglobales bacterium]